MESMTSRLGALGYSPNEARMIAELSQELIRHIMQNHKYLFHEFNDEISKALLFAARVHVKQRRKTGEPYIIHPIAVARTCSDAITSDNESELTVLLSAALLHDVIEDSGEYSDHKVTYEELSRKFSPDIADLVQAVTDFDPGDFSLTRREIDEMSHEKLLDSFQSNPHAAIIKAADRIHNLKSMKGISYEKCVEKVRDTEEVLIPYLKSVSAFRLVQILSDLCFYIRNPSLYNATQTNYKKLLHLNRHVLSREKAALFDFYINNAKNSSCTIKAVTIYDRYIKSIFDVTNGNIANVNHSAGPELHNSVALKDIFLIIDDNYSGKPFDPFIQSLPELYNLKDDTEASYRFCVIDVRRDSNGEFYFLLEDRFSIRYRVFAEKESDYYSRFHGLMVDGAMPKVVSARSAEYIANDGKDVIRVFKRDGSPMYMPRGSTVLDFAFKLHERIGLTAKGAYLNNKKQLLELHHQLYDGDKVEIVADYNKYHHEKDIVHASIGWFSFIRCKDSVRKLIRYLEGVEKGRIRCKVFDSSGTSYELPVGSTVLDLAFAIDPERLGLRFKEAYPNKSKKPVNASYTLHEGDIYRFETDTSEEFTPPLDWLNIVRTDEARGRLISYFHTVLSGQAR